MFRKAKVKRAKESYASIRLPLLISTLVILSPAKEASLNGSPPPPPKGPLGQTTIQNIQHVSAVYKKTAFTIHSLFNSFTLPYFHWSSETSRKQYKA